MKRGRTSRSRKVFIGTSGLVLRETKAQYPPAFKNFTRLQYYSTIFNSIEINSTFYKLHRPATLTRWSREVSDKFLFTVKLWREITHTKYLDYAKSDLSKFMLTLGVDHHKQGCILVQFPASIDVSFVRKVDNLLNDIIELNNNSNWQICVEFRHNSWYIREVFEMLASHNTSLVLHDIPKSKFLVAPVQTEVVYLRLHGVDGKYRGSYTDKELGGYAQLVSGWLDSGKDVFVYFNNTIGQAYENALSLGKKIKEIKMTTPILR